MNGSAAVKPIVSMTAPMAARRGVVKLAALGRACLYETMFWWRTVDSRR
jgi:hypothetical protein